MSAPANGMKRSGWRSASAATISLATNVLPQVELVEARDQRPADIRRVQLGEDLGVVAGEVGRVGGVLLGSHSGFGEYLEILE